MGLFTCFSVISGIELLYWIIFKVMSSVRLLATISQCPLQRSQFHNFSVLQVFFHKKDTDSSEGGAADKKDLGWRERRSQNEETEESEVVCSKEAFKPNAQVSSDKDDVEAGGGGKVVETSCCKSCKALASNVKLEVMEAEIAELKKAMKVKTRGWEM